MSSPRWETGLASGMDIVGVVPSPPSGFSKSPLQVILPDTPPHGSPTQHFSPLPALHRLHHHLTYQLTCRLSALSRGCSLQERGLHSSVFPASVTVAGTEQVLSQGFLSE